ncbi:PepSY-associated TM helix domain-containing protein [Sinomicrobium soli]|uniref:PepSY-associated TM helix domain-containing protein n=1 Tax=Sinomicrobium sp. N-1-3-6 TaxID=2219864 RepID=UPI000DCE8980|nr:PepSY-associated TM helix domain-containing protein [Sinomicrobium sp. N-1-3-6]RAV29156.1 PepSY domain-containing protein [Sinomicrobium sp. N-1-3-6]
MRKKRKKSLFRRINDWLHLWLGLLSGIVVFVVCLTAAIWVFRDEVAYFTKPFNRIEAQDIPFSPPSVLKRKAGEYLENEFENNPVLLLNLTYRGPDRTAYAGYIDNTANVYMGYLHLNPYTGQVVHNELFAESNTRKFFLFIRAGHRFFWLPPHIGSPIVGTSCIIFLVTLITGLIWWYPKKWNRTTRNKSFKIKWNAKWKRLNIDLHNVLGFYVLLFAFILTYTGVYYSFTWFRDSYHYVLGAEDRTAFNNTRKTSPVLQKKQTSGNPIDMIWEALYYDEGKQDGDLSLSFPADSISPIAITYNPVPDKYYRAHTRYFDPYTLKEINTARGFSSRQSNIPFEELSAGEKTVRMNFDIHVGTIGGLPTKILACIASLIGASLPVTGFIIWYNRKWGKRRHKSG